MDYASTTPLLDEVYEEARKYESVGNPSSLHWAGREAKEAIENARDKVAEILNAKRYEIVFNSGATEGNNNVIKGVAFYYLKKGITPHIITTSIEHSSVRETARHMREFGCEITEIRVDKFGFPDLDELKKSIKKNTVLVSMMAVNNEIGTILPVEEAVKIVKGIDDIAFHVDAVQGIGKIKINLQRLPIDFLTFSGHKIYAMKGAGVMFIRKGVKIDKFIDGGNQEDGIRGGTQFVAGAVSIAKSMEILYTKFEEFDKHLRKIQKKFEEGVSELGGRIIGHPEMRVPNISAVMFKGIENETAMIFLDRKGIAVSTGSACKSGSKEPSHVLKAIGLSDEDARSVLRFSFGILTKEEEIEITLSAIKEMLEKLSEK